MPHIRPNWNRVDDFTFHAYIIYPPRTTLISCLNITWLHRLKLSFFRIFPTLGVPLIYRKHSASISVSPWVTVADHSKKMFVIFRDKISLKIMLDIASAFTSWATSLFITLPHFRLANSIQWSDDSVRFSALIYSRYRRLLSVLYPRLDNL